MFRKLFQRYDRMYLYIQTFLFFPAVRQGGQRESECRGAVRPHGGAAGCFSVRHLSSVQGGLTSGRADGR